MYLSDIHYDEPFFASGVFDFYFADARVGVFDIETTGLSSERHKIVLGGLLTPAPGGGLRVRQFFAEGGHEETELLQLYTDTLSEVDVLVSYNGNRFDIPFVGARLAHHHRAPAFRHQMSFDLYQIVRNYSPLPSILPNLKQKTVENYMGLWSDRKDRISGAESVRLYHEFVATKDPKLREYILLHNRDDLLQLARLLAVLEKLDLHQVAANVGFPVRHEDAMAFVRKIVLRRSALEFSGLHRNIPLGCLFYDTAYQAVLSDEDQAFRVKLPCQYEQGNTFADLPALGISPEPFRVYPCCQSDYLILREGEAVHYGPLNHLIRELLRCILQKGVG